MSQAKVDQYKKEKANRKQTMAREKVKRTIAKICGTIIGIVLVAWIGVSTVDFVKESRPVETIYCKMDAVSDYLTDLYAEDTEDAKEDSKDEAKNDSKEETTESDTEKTTEATK